ncbi:MAG: type II secretion system F family protein [Planctomycetota bacterium]|nr:type II secretion system F family protein [Planctomycetota bacterium]
MMLVLARYFDLVAELIGGGVPLLEAMELARTETDDEGLKDALGSVVQRIREGEGLADSLERCPGVIPAFAIGMIRFGEHNGCLDRTFAYLGRPDGLTTLGRLDTDDRRRRMFDWLSHLLNWGENLIKALRVVRSGVEKESRAEGLDRIVAALEGGRHFAEAIEGHTRIFPEPLPTMIALAEEAGCLDRLFASLAEDLRGGALRLAEEDESPDPGDSREAVKKFHFLMALCLENGMPYPQALDFLSGVEGHTELSGCLREMVEANRQEGWDMIPVMERHPHLFPPSATRMIAVSVMAGRPDETHRKIARGMARGLFLPARS